ncbi:hypothetical protein VNI00_017126 [Paramarasmius palmivorus]|uniref:Uncharacterized protein n=1 Tax=Paramarasmius palmivorus TaxID=297713 RepID=A0AAW0B7N6_9AGAR
MSSKQTVAKSSTHTVTRISTSKHTKSPIQPSNPKRQGIDPASDTSNKESSDEEDRDTERMEEEDVNIDKQSKKGGKRQKAIDAVLKQVVAKARRKGDNNEVDGLMNVTNHLIHASQLMVRGINPWMSITYVVGVWQASTNNFEPHIAIEENLSTKETEHIKTAARELQRYCPFLMDFLFVVNRHKCFQEYNTLLKLIAKCSLTGAKLVLVTPAKPHKNCIAQKLKLVKFNAPMIAYYQILDEDIKELKKDDNLRTRIFSFWNENVFGNPAGLVTNKQQLKKPAKDSAIERLKKNRAEKAKKRADEKKAKELEAQLEAAEKEKSKRSAKDDTDDEDDNNSKEEEEEEEEEDEGNDDSEEEDNEEEAAPKKSVTVKPNATREPTIRLTAVKSTAVKSAVIKPTTGKEPITKPTIVKPAKKVSGNASQVASQKGSQKGAQKGMKKNSQCKSQEMEFEATMTVREDY